MSGMSRRPASPGLPPVVLICGGGIGGLVAALCLDRAGLHAVVFEAARQIRPLGVGTNLLPHAVRILTALNLGPALAAAGIATADLRYYTRRGEPISAEPRGIAAGYRWPQYSVHRGELQMLLLDAVRTRLGPDRVHTGHALASFETTASGVEATFTDRSTGAAVANVHGDLLIGADGIHSVVRAHHYPDEREPVFSGRLLWRGVTEADPFLTGRSMIMAGHANQKFVAYPIGPGSSGRMRINRIAERYVANPSSRGRSGGVETDSTPVVRDWNRTVEPSHFLPWFEDWRFPWLDVPALIRGAGAVYEFPMSDRDPVGRWSFGRTTLLGDAAHPMYPVGSNGASQAILNALALALALANALRRAEPGADLADALTNYEAARLGPTSQIVLANRQQGPEAVMQMVEERAPDGFKHLPDVISDTELADTARHYKRLAGFDPDALNRQGDTLFQEADDAHA